MVTAGRDNKVECTGHWWVIEAANGPTSMGECRFCHQRREFYNAFPGVLFNSTELSFKEERVYQ